MTRPGKVIVLGAGGHAKVVVSTLRAAGWAVAAIFDDDVDMHGSLIQGVRVEGRLSDATGVGCPAVIGIGDNRARRRIAADLPLEWVRAVHPWTSIDSSVRVGAGSVVFAGAVIQPDTRVGEHTIVNTAASIDHDCVIGAYAHIAPGVRLAGGVRVGDGAFVGIGSSVILGAEIGSWSTVGAGGVVISDVDEGSVVVGVPARPVSRSS